MNDLDNISCVRNGETNITKPSTHQILNESDYNDSVDVTNDLKDVQPLSSKDERCNDINFSLPHSMINNSENNQNMDIINSINMQPTSSKNVTVEKAYLPQSSVCYILSEIDCKDNMVSKSDFNIAGLESFENLTSAAEKRPPQHLISINSVPQKCNSIQPTNGLNNTLPLLFKSVTSDGLKLSQSMIYPMSNKAELFNENMEHKNRISKNMGLSQPHVNLPSIKIEIGDCMEMDVMPESVNIEPTLLQNEVSDQIRFEQSLTHNSIKTECDDKVKPVNNFKDVNPSPLMIMIADKEGFTEPLIHPMSIKTEYDHESRVLSEESVINIQSSSTSNSERNNDILSANGKTYKAFKYLNTDVFSKLQQTYNFLPSNSRTDLVTKHVFGGHVTQHMSSNIEQVKYQNHSVDTISLEAPSVSAPTVQQTSDDVAYRLDTCKADVDLVNSRNISLNPSSNQPLIFLSSMPANLQNIANCTNNLHFSQASNGTLILFPALPQLIETGSLVASLDHTMSKAEFDNLVSSSASVVTNFQSHVETPINKTVPVSTNLAQPLEASDNKTVLSNVVLSPPEEASNKTESEFVNMQSPIQEFKQNTVSTLNSSNMLKAKLHMPKAVSILRPSPERNSAQQDKIETVLKTVSRTIHNQTQMNSYNPGFFNSSYSNQSQINHIDKGTGGINLSPSNGAQTSSFNSRAFNFNHSGQTDVKSANSEKHNSCQSGQTQMTNANSEKHVFRHPGQTLTNSKNYILGIPTRPRPDISNATNKAPTSPSLDELLSPLYQYIKENKCTLCGFETASKDLARGVRRHLETHLHTKRFECKECGKSFVTSERLSLHRSNSHSDKGPLECKECGKKYHTKISLRHHMRKHRLNKGKHNCMICSMEYHSLASLKEHLRVHTGERPYVCSVCNQSFRTKGILDNHSYRHLSEKLHKCTVCDKAYNKMSQLKEHMYLHGKNSPHICKICDKKFNYRSNLVQHMLIHSNARRHECIVCGMKFKLGHHLKSHLATAHTVIKN